MEFRVYIEHMVTARIFEVRSIIYLFMVYLTKFTVVKMQEGSGRDLIWRTGPAFA